MPFVVMFHTPSATLSTLITGDARLSLSHLDADFGRRSGGRGHKTNDHLLSISPRDPLPLIGKRVRYVTSFRGGGRAAAELYSSAVLRVPRKLPNLLTRKEERRASPPTQSLARFLKWAGTETQKPLDTSWITCLVEVRRRTADVPRNTHEGGRFVLDLRRG